MKATRVFHKKGNSRTYDFLTNTTLEECIEQHDWLREPDRVILETRIEEISLRDDEYIKEYFENGLLMTIHKHDRPDENEDEKAWEEMYKRTTGNGTIPNGGIM